MSMSNSPTPTPFGKASQWYESKFKALKPPEKLYKIGTLLAIPLILAPITLKSIGLEQVTPIAISLIIYTSIALWTLAFFMEAYPILKKLLDDKLFLIFFGGISFAIFKMSEISASHFVNKLTGLDPSAIPNASAALVAFFLPLTWLYAIAAITIIALVIMLIFSVTSFFDSKGDGTISIGRISAAASVITLITIFGALYDDKSSLLYITAKHIAISAEYFPNKQCSNISKDFYIAKIEADLVSAYIPKEDKFSKMKCISD